MGARARAAMLAVLAAGPVAARAQDEPVTLEAIEARGLRAVEERVAHTSPPVLLEGGTVLTAAGTRLDPGWVLIEEGRIAALGTGDPPDTDATRLDVSGRFVTPGLIDTHSHLGVYPSPRAKAHGDGNEATNPTTAEVWAEHSVWPQDPGLERALAGGVTTLQVLPGSANLVGGRGVVLRVVPARGSRAMRFPGAPETLKMACGENPKRNYGDRGGPSTRMGNVAGHRQAFIEATEYLAEWDDYRTEYAQWTTKKEASEAATTRRQRKDHPDPGSPPDPPDRDLAKETLAGVIEGDILPQVHCYRADDMLSFLQVADEFGFEIRGFHHALEAYKIRDVLAAREVSASTWADWWGFKLEAYDGIPHNAALSTEAGVRVVIHSDSSIGIQRLNQEAAKAYRAGRMAGIDLTEDDALKWITLHPAWTVGIDGETGSLEVGKRADVVVWDAHPFSVYASAQWVFVDGALEYDASRSRLRSDFTLGREVVP